MEDDVTQVLAAARARADALAHGDADALLRILHPDFRWTAHTGESFDRAGYVRSNTEGRTFWRAQALVEPAVVVEADTAVLRCVVVDEVEAQAGVEVFRMPMTQVWVRLDGHWVCIAGHAGPRLGGADGG